MVSMLEKSITSVVIPANELVAFSRDLVFTHFYILLKACFI